MQPNSIYIYIYIFIFFYIILANCSCVLGCTSLQDSALLWYSYQRHSQVWYAQTWPHKVSQLVFCPKDLWPDGNKTVNTWWKLFVSCRNHYRTKQEKTWKNTLLPLRAPRHTESFPELMWFRLLISYLMQCGAKLQSCKCWKFRTVTSSTSTSNTKYL